ncbi:DUF3037 domain-containing protein [Winogradskya consettensis]|uniref:DUF3037 domain-containing protein n=1 Tax=Winogradskya consettensis TaxID=113560 RepID=A0A919VXH3_9ACTN|nr:DUF3037 domain-containing protein [Actinoplanes consettensis]GIM80696.1 hypothetical protein Aco04nite_72130 [Actinoplanes consettensis]
MKAPYEYAIIRAVPRVERGELINVGVVLYSHRLDFLAARTHLHEPRLLALDPNADLDSIRAALNSWEITCAGGTDSGAARQMKQGERFRWMVAPRSTILQAGPVHMGLAENPAAELDRLVELLVR